MSILTHISFLLVFLFTNLTNCWAQNSEGHPLSVTGSISPFEVSPGSSAKLKLKISIKSGFKAYTDKFQLNALEPYPVKIGSLKISPIKEFYDKFSKANRSGVVGEAEIETTIEFENQINSKNKDLVLNLEYQACSETYCLFPKILDIKIPIKVIEENEKRSALPLQTKGLGMLEDTFLNAKERGLPYLFFFVFLAGVLTSLTPCILPMLPITVAILGKGHHAKNKKRMIINSLIYVFGIASTYSILGLIAASTGSLFGSFLSQPIVQIFFAVLFIILGIGQFGFFDVQTPLTWQNKFNKLGKLPGSFGIYVAGLVAGLIAGPCVGPVLVGILTFVSQSRDLVLGFWLLFVYAIGFGQLLVILGATTNLLDHLPKNHALMKASKIGLGLALIAGGLFYLSLVWPKTIASEVIKGPVVEEIKKSQLDWKLFSEKALQEAAAQGKPVVVDFFADWCLACKELEEKTFSDPKVEEVLKEFVLLRFDATNDSKELEEARAKYGLVGLPTVLFFEPSGQRRADLVLNEFEEPEKFISRLQKVRTK